MCSWEFCCRNPNPDSNALEAAERGRERVHSSDPQPIAEAELCAQKRPPLKPHFPNEERNSIPSWMMLLSNSVFTGRTATLLFELSIQSLVNG